MRSTNNWLQKITNLESAHADHPLGLNKPLPDRCVLLLDTFFASSVATLAILGSVQFQAAALLR
jgi:hypothetical protein